MGEPRALVDRWWELFEKGQWDDLATIVADDADVTLPGGMRLRGPAEVRPMLQGYRDAFPNLRHEIVDAIEATDGIAVELRITGTHTGVMRSPGGDIPPTGRPVVWESVDIIRVRDGKITSWHAYFDQVAFLVQLGLMPAPA